jgi:hypothetical protein
MKSGQPRGSGARSFHAGCHIIGRVPITGEISVLIERNIPGNKNTEDGPDVWMNKSVINENSVYN